MGRAPSVNDLVLRWRELRDQGRAVSPEELCADCPELLNEVRRRLQPLLSGDATCLDVTPSDRPESARAETPEPTPRAEVPPADRSGEGETPLVGARYRPLRLHARGGRGEVFLARDEELSREVALKRIRPPYAGDAGCRRRFLREGEITAGLEHPGVVPVYGLTRDADGQPCYAMRFIRGETLQEAIKRLHATPAAGRGLALRQLLARFVGVCNTIAYAHSRGVLHRDLKPTNIMLGDYGETLVVDWGLAGRLDPDGGSHPSTAGDSAEVRAYGPEHQTATGDLLGTPAFMSPEQAKGRNKEVGPASDIYGLGATLYTLLTGTPPFTAGSLGEVLIRVEHGAFPPPRQRRPDTPRALEAICLKAMALEPLDRYATALDLAADVERWLADEPVHAHREPLRVRAGRWARRHRVAVAATAAATLVAVALGGVGAWWLDRLRTERRRDVEGELAAVGRLQGEARWSEARAVLRQAQDRLGDSGPADLRQALDRRRQDLDLVARLDAIALNRVTLVGEKLDNPGADRGYAAAFAEAGLGQPGEDPETVAGRVRASTVAGPLVAALDDWAGCAQDEARRDWLLDVVRRADPDPWRDRARDPALWRDRAALARLAAEAEGSEQPPRLVSVLAHRLGADGVALLRQAQARHPEDFWLTFELGLALTGSDPAGAAGYYRAALALRPGTVAALNNLGNVLYDQQRLEEARAAYQQALALDPDHGPAHNGLGNVLHHQRRLKEARAEFERALALLPNFAEAHNGLGVVWHDEGHVKEAEAEYRRACDLDQDLAEVHQNLANALFDQRRLKEAEREYRRASRLNPRLVVAHQNLGMLLGMQGHLPEARAELERASEIDPLQAAPHDGLGNVFRIQNRLDEAQAQYRIAIALNPKLAEPHNGLGNVFHRQGRLAEAQAEYRRACELDSRLGVAHGNLADTLQEQGRLEEALAEYRKTEELGRHTFTAQMHACEQQLALRKRLPALAAGLDRPANPAERLAFAGLCQQPAQGRFALAVRLYTEAFRADPKLAENPLTGHRYNAACAAAQGGCGRGTDGGTLADAEKARLRQQALDWLRADLAFWSDRLRSDQPAARAQARQTLAHWPQDPDLAGVRDPAAVAQLPEAEWRPWLAFWADVEAALKRAPGTR